MGSEEPTILCLVVQLPFGGRAEAEFGHLRRPEIDRIVGRDDARLDRVAPGCELFRRALLAELDVVLGDLDAGILGQVRHLLAVEHVHRDLEGV